MTMVWTAVGYLWVIITYTNGCAERVICLRSFIFWPRINGTNMAGGVECVAIRFRDHLNTRQDFLVDLLMVSQNHLHCFVSQSVHEILHFVLILAGIIGRVYKQGETITVTTKITANHKGYMVYKICPVNDKSNKVIQSCLDKWGQLPLGLSLSYWFWYIVQHRYCWRYPLTDLDGNQKISVYKALGDSPGTIKTQLRLPASLTCSQCVVQWTYTAGITAIGPSHSAATSNTWHLYQ